MTKAIGYIRVSTDKQADQGQSLEVQELKIKQYCSLYDLELVEIVIDSGASAKTLDRQGLQKALKILGKEADALIISKLDRLTRRVVDLGNLIDSYFQKYSLLSVSEQVDTRTPTGRLLLNLLSSVSQWERETIGQRTSEAMQHKKSKLEYTGGKVPYGYSLDEDGINLAENAEEQKVIVEAKEIREGGLSLRKVSDELAVKGFLARGGKKFTAEMIKRITQ